MKITTWLVGAAIFGAFLALYLATPTSYYTFDAISYAGAVRLADTAGPKTLFHPHHILFNGIGWLFWHLVRHFSPEISSIAALQMLNAFAGAIGLAVFFFVLRRLLMDTARGGSDTRWVTPTAAAAAVAAGLTFGWWVGSTDGRVYIPPMAAILAAFYFAFRTARTASAGSAAALGGLIGLAVLLHQSHGLFLLVAAAAVLLAPARAQGKLRMAGAALGVFVLVAGIPYGIVLWLREQWHQSEGLGWTLSYAKQGTWWNFDFLGNLKKDLYAFRHAFLAVKPMGGSRIPTVTFYGAGAIVFFSSVLVVVGRVGRWLLSARAKHTAEVNKEDKLIDSAQQRDSLFIFNVLAAVWIVSYAAFFTLWMPGFCWFWIPTISAWIMLLVVNGSALTSRALVSGIAAAAAVCFAVTNLIFFVVPKMSAEANKALMIARQVKAETPQGSIIVVAGMGHIPEMETYLPYFAERDIISLNQTMGRHGPDGIRWLVQEIEKDLAAGRRTYVFSEVFDSGKAWKELGKRYGLKKEDVARALSPFRPQEAFRLSPTLPVYELRLML